jgi:hypothetical protein
MGTGERMRTISNAAPSPGAPKIKHCPATRLITRGSDETTPLRESSDFHRFSPDHYEEFFRTDHLVPAAFFQPDRDPKKLIKYEDLSLRYIWDGTGHSDHHLPYDRYPHWGSSDDSSLGPRQSPFTCTGNHGGAAMCATCIVGNLRRGETSQKFVATF